MTCTSHVCTLSKINMADSSLREGSSISRSDYSDCEASMEGNDSNRIMIGLMSVLVKSGPGDLNRQDEPKIEPDEDREPVRRSRLN